MMNMRRMESLSESKENTAMGEMVLQKGGRQSILRRGRKRLRREHRFDIINLFDKAADYVITGSGTGEGAMLAFLRRERAGLSRRKSSSREEEQEDPCIGFGLSK